MNEQLGIIQSAARGLSHILVMVDRKQAAITGAERDILRNVAELRTREDLRGDSDVQRLISSVREWDASRQALKELSATAEKERSAFRKSAVILAPQALVGLTDKTLVRGLSNKAAVTVAVKIKESIWNPVAALMLCQTRSELADFITRQVDVERFKTAVQKGQIESLPYGIYAWEEVYEVRVTDAELKTLAAAKIEAAADVVESD
jgi:hypothetical protein